MLSQRPLAFFSGLVVLTCVLVLPGVAKAAPKQPKQEQKLSQAIPTERDVRYGRYDRNLLDLYRANTKTPAPVLIHFHGGGWVGGDKAGFDPAPYLKSGISVVSANYRLVAGTKDAALYPAPMLDCARVVQFVRSKAKEWNIDPERIALTGGSAGAVNCMWIAYRDDMAKPDSADPIERFSTRVTCLMPEAGPTTLDPKLIVQRVGGPPSVHGCLLPFFDVKKLNELQTEKKQALVRDASPITHVTKDDPPTYLRYPTPLGGTPLPANTSVMVSIHHAEFGAMIKEKLDTAGVENVLQVVGDGKPADAGLNFLRRHLGVADEKSAAPAARKRPNVLLITTDQQRGHDVGAAGCKWAKTPNMDRIASQGVFFTRSYCSYPVCSPSRGSLHTGRMPHEIGVDRNEMGIQPGVAVSGQVFRDAGYDTGYCGKWHLPLNIPIHNNAGFETLNKDRRQDKKKRQWASDVDEAAADVAIEFLKRKRDKPFYLVVSLENPHDVCWLASDIVSGPLHKKYGPFGSEELPPLPANFGAVVPALAELARPKHDDWNEGRCGRFCYGYYRLLEEVDRQIGRVLEELRRSGQDDNTLIVFTSDHGEGLGSHGWYGKQMFYEEEAGVPLIVSLKGITPAKRIDRTHLVSTLDVLPTICDYAGIKIPDQVRGESLRNVIEHPEQPGHEYIVSEMSPGMPGSPPGPGRSFMLRTAKYKYMVFSSAASRPTEVLFDLEADPGETKDLAAGPAMADVLKRHRELLAAWKKTTIEEQCPIKGVGRSRAKKAKARS